MEYNSEDKSLSINRGDRGTIRLKLKDNKTFSVGDKIKFSVVNRRDYNDVVFQKEYTVTEESNTFDLVLTKEDTKIGDGISKPVTYNYEIEYNSDQTLLGYDNERGKQFILYPEAGTKGSVE